MIASAIRSSGISRAKPSIISIDVRGAGDDQVQIALLQLVLRGEGDELAVDVAQADRADRARGTAAARGTGPSRRRSSPARRRRSAGRWPGRRPGPGPRRETTRGTCGRIGRSMSRDGERFLGRRPAFALEEPAGKLPGGGDPLAIIAGQGEEIDPGPGGGRWRWPRGPPSRHIRSDNCPPLVWPALRFQSKESVPQSVFQHVFSM